MKTQLAEIRKTLHQLSQEIGIVALKTGTEVEDMDFPEIQILREISQGIVPIVVKLGGAEARNDMRRLIAIQIDGMIAPLIESSYALRKFIQTKNELKLTTRDAQTSKKIWNAINIESKTGVQAIDEIIDSPYFGAISQVTAARSDLSQSLQLHSDNIQVMQICAEILKKVKARGKRTVIGGNIQPTTIPIILEMIAPDLISTRNLVLCADQMQKTSDQGKRSIRKALGFEIQIYDYLSNTFLSTMKKEEYSKRIEVLKQRSHGASEKNKTK